MKTTIAQAPRDLLSLLRVVESAPDGDLDWAKHCTRQQAVILRLLIPGGQVTDLVTLADTVGIPISLMDHIPVPGIAFPIKDGWHIHISESLTPTAQIRVALHELKHVIDHPLRHKGEHRAAGFSAADYEYLADYFAACALAEHEP
ncbi:ImmA/IrrE family metallo-endopeptidase [Mycobacteroides abscessus]|uniref:ImmA/IrrE family metallo-endopeptidase n=1 Tax=Mycobacteroides abscessus TaxID=36809 RepID=UPI0021048601|nr:ImmA/IrrE family metallo-endopeptidase [Mycobacteroides abscessus]